MVVRNRRLLLEVSFYLKNRVPVYNLIRFAKSMILGEFLKVRIVA
jgi:hypothetical protein